MKRARRLVALAALTLAVVVGPALVGAIPHAAADDWVCVGLEGLDKGVCLGDPLPDSLPIP
jgi:hypothetical protein